MQSSARLVAAVLGAVLCGCAGMGSSPRVDKDKDHPNWITLEIEKSTTTKAGYVSTFGSNGKMYVYRFSGGDDMHGNVNVKRNEGQDVKVWIMLNAAANFAIDTIDFIDDTKNQLKTHIEAGGAKAHIKDTNTDDQDAYYSVKVHDGDSTSPADIYCDPRIVNN